MREPGSAERPEASRPEDPRPEASRAQPPRRRGPFGPWFTFACGVLKPAVTLTSRTTWTGLDNVPAEGGIIVAANHTSLVDPVLLADLVVYGMGALPRFLAKDAMFRGNGLVARVMRGAQQIPVNRGAADASAALGAAVEALRQGECVVIYPEGTTTRDPELWPMQARTGVARLALLSGAPVLPVAQWGAHRIHRRGSRRVHVLPRSPVLLRVGPPVDLSAWQGRPLDAQVLREATAAVMSAVTDELERLRAEQRPSEVYVHLRSV